MHKLLLLSLFAVMSATCISVAQVNTFSKVFSNFPLTAENGFVVKPYEDHYYLFSAMDCLDSPQYICCSLTKMNQFGDIEWVKHYPFHPGSSNAVIHEGKIYVSGHTQHGDRQFVLSCFNLEGEMLWQHTYGSTQLREDFPRLALSAKNTWILCGTQDKSPNSESFNIYIVETDIDGETISEQLFGEENEFTIPFNAIRKSSGDLLVSYVYCPDVFCFVDLNSGLFQIDTDGNINILKTFPTSFSPQKTKIREIDSTNMAFLWYIDQETPNFEPTPPAIFYLDEQGNLLDTLIFTNKSMKEIHQIVVDDSKQLIGGGYDIVGPPLTHFTMLAPWVFGVSAEKELLWERVYIDTTQNGFSFGLNDIAPTNDGGYIAFGTHNNTMTGVLESHNLVLKMDATGCLKPNCGQFNYISGTSEATFLRGADLLLFPNPCHSQLHITFPEERFNANPATFYLMSAEGRLKMQAPLSAGLTSLDVSQMPPGLYFGIINVGNEILLSKKITIAR